MISDTSIPAEVLTCPAGSSLDLTKLLSINQVGVAKYNTYTTGVLKANSIDLPNTPVLAPVV